MLRTGNRLWVSLGVTLRTLGALAQQAVTFEWGPPITQSQLQECGTVNVQIWPLDNQTTLGTAPYYMFAYEPGGPTTVSSIGSDPNNLVWTVNHSAGKTVILQVADALGNSGGLGPTSYSVNAGTSTSCHPAAFSTPVNLTTPTTQLTTCQPLVLDISGGQRPYTITIAAIDGRSVTNITLGLEDEQYIWTDRAEPGSGLFAVAHDMTGTYSVTTDLIGLSGSTDTSCPNGYSATGAETTEPSASATSAALTKHSLVPVAAGATAGALLVGSIIAVCLIMYCRRRRERGNRAYGVNRRTTLISTASRPDSPAEQQRTLWKDCPGFSSRPFSNATDATAGTRPSFAGTGTITNPDFNPYEKYNTTPSAQMTHSSQPSSWSIMDMLPPGQDYLNHNAMNYGQQNRAHVAMSVSGSSETSAESIARAERDLQHQRMLAVTSAARRQDIAFSSHGHSRGSSGWKTSGLGDTDVPPHDHYGISSAPPSYPESAESLLKTGKER